MRHYNCSYTISATNASPLPVKLKQFTAWKEGSRNALNSITTEEGNHNYFEVQRSEDGDTFTNLNRIICRLKQVDLDGKFWFSQVVEIGRDKQGIIDLVQLPVPTNDLNFTVRSTRAGKLQMNIYSTEENLKSFGWIMVNKGLNIFNKDISSLVKGHYILALNLDNERITRTFPKF